MPRRAPNESADPPTSTITIGPDGRLYMQEVTTDLLEVASVICAGDVQFQSRIERAIGRVRQDHEHGKDHQQKASSSLGA